MIFFGSKSVGVEFHDQWIQVVELRKRGKQIELEAFNRVPVPPGIIENGEIKDKDSLKDLLLDAFENANPRSITRKRISVILPSREIFSHIFKLPAKLSLKEVRQVIELEAENIVPFALEDLYWDYRIVDKEEDKVPNASQYVLFSSVPKSTADSYAELFQSADIHVDAFGISVDAIMQIVNPYLQDESRNGIISFDPLTTQIFLLDGRKLRIFFSSNDGYEKFVRTMQEEHQWTEEEFRKKWEEGTLEKEKLDELKNFIQTQYKQIKKLLPNIKSEPLKELFITGEYSSLNLFYDLGQSAFPETQVSIGDPKRNFSVIDEKFIGKHMKTGGKVPLSIYFTNAIGIALTVLRKKLFTPINLLPTHIKTQNRHKNMQTLGVVSALMFTFLNLLLSVILFVQHENSSFQRAKLEVEKQAIEKTLYGTRYQEIQKLFSDFNNELIYLTKIEAGLFSVPHLIEDIYTILPTGITLTTFEFDDLSLSLELKGVAQTREDLLEFQQILKTAEYVSEVTLPLSNFDEKTDISFSIFLKLDYSQLPDYGIRE